jgi:Protein of unknown function (DUF3352)
MPTALRRRLVVVFLALATTAVAVAGCASSGASGGSTDPAALVPASAPLYAEAVLAGDGREQADAQAALGRILRTSDPTGELVRLFDRGHVRFARDVEPWLGDRVGAAVLGVGGRDADHVVVADSRDDGQAQAALGRILPGADRRAYRGVDYRVDTRRGFAAAVIDGTVVLGTENGLKAAVDASKGSSLAESDALKQARDKVRQERSAFLYVDVAGILRGALSAAGGQAAQLAPLVEPVAQALPKTIAAGLDAEPDLLRIDSTAFGGGAGSGPTASGADALAALPADAWLGVGVGDLGGRANAFLDRVASGGGLAAVGLQALLGQAQQTLGLDIRRDLLGWMGDAGLYLAGSTAADRRAAIVVASKDPAATARAVHGLERLARSRGDVTPLDAPGVTEGFTVRGGGSGGELLVAATGDRFVLAVGRPAAARAALTATGARLGDAATFRAAAAKLSGVRPSFFLDVQALARHGGEHGRGRDARRLREDLGAFGAVIGGARRDGGDVRADAVVTLR